MVKGMPYVRRSIDDQLDELFPHLAAIALEGPKGVGKTATATQRAASIVELDRPEQIQLLDADTSRLERLPKPLLLDEWQRHPRAWDLVRRSVDANPNGGQFLLAGSASPTDPPAHSGAGRIVRLRMRPLSLFERNLATPTVSLNHMLRATHSEGLPSIHGSSSLNLTDYVRQIVASGFPGIRELPHRARQAQIRSYVDRIADVEFVEQGHRLAKPAALRAWMEAYSAATATTASYNAILDAATPGDADKPSRATTGQYREMLTRLFLLDPVPGWVPATNALTRLAQAPKHHLADPALAAQILGVTEDSLLSAETNHNRPHFGDGFLLGQFFESLIALSLRVYAQHNSATVSHLRTKNGDHEIDFIVQGQDRRVVALEVKLGPLVEDKDVVHLKWLRLKLGPGLADAAVITTGTDAYRRKDGIAVIPASLLAP